MSCLPVPRCLKRLGRYLSKMFSNKDWVDWKRLNEEDKENVPLDFETSAHFCSNATQQSTITDGSMSSWRRTFRETPNKTYAKSTYLNGFSNGSSTSGYESTSSVKQSSESISLEFQIYNDVFGSSFPSLLSQLPSFNYSPMSNFSDNSAMTSSDFFAHDFNTTPRSNHDQEYENLRHDFEMNGLTVDTTDLDFLPSNSSTPKPIRRDTPMPNRGYQQELPQQQQQMPMIPPQWMTNFSSMNNRKPQSRKFKPHKNSLQDHCVFCKNNGQDEKIYRTHTVKDAKGRVLCPVLRLYRCPICGADGDKAHTTKYCPKKPIITPEDLIPMQSRSNRCGFSHRKVF